MPTRRKSSGFISGSSMTWCCECQPRGERAGAKIAHLSQFADLVSESSDASKRSSSGVLHAHVVHERVDLPRQYPTRTASAPAWPSHRQHTHRMMVKVVMSSETRVPVLSLCFGTALLQPTT